MLQSFNKQKRNSSREPSLDEYKETFWLFRSRGRIEVFIRTRRKREWASRPAQPGGRCAVTELRSRRPGSRR